MASPLVSPVKQLAAPRGVSLVDELTGKPATLQNVVCGVTYFYSNRESLELDWSVLEHVGQLLADLKFEREAQGTAAERVIHAGRARDLTAEIVRVTFELASQRLIAGDFERANPSALRCLRALQALHGTSSAELVPAYLLLGEVALGMGRPAAAEEFLSMSSFILSRLPDADPAVRSRLFRNFGKLYLSQGNTTAAAEAFAKDVLAASQGLADGGPESLGASVGLWNLGKTLLAGGGGKGEAAMACFDRVVSIWHNRITGRRSPLAEVVGKLGGGGARGAAEAAAAAATAAAAAAPPPGTAAGATTRPPPPPTRALDSRGRVPPFEPAVALTPVQGAEGLEILSHIRGVRAAHLGESHVAVAEARFTTVLVLVASEDGDAAKGLELLDAAEPVLKEALGPKHPTVLLAERVRRSLAEIGAEGSSAAPVEDL
jgi:hypothetical protein